MPDGILALVLVAILAIVLPRLGTHPAPKRRRRH